MQTEEDIMEMSISGQSIIMDERMKEAEARARKFVAEKDDRISKLEAALRSISANTCCETCREAALVAQKALEK